MVRLPSEYQEVEYLESTGEQYIVTDVYPRQDLSFHCKYRPNSNASPGYGNAFGSRKSSTVQEFQLSAYKGGCVCIGTRNVTGHIYVNEINVIDFDGKTTVTINGIEYSITTSDDQHDMPICLFSISENKSFGVQKQAGKIYELSFSNIANFIPCYRKSDSKPGMYDTVTKTFYTNAGTGEFLVGNDISYDPINLLETRRKILLNTPHLESASGQIATFQTDMSTPLKECKISFLPVQEGSGDPSPDNVRPITGWDGVTVTRCGKNLFDGILQNGRYVNQDGIWVFEKTEGWRSTEIIEIKPNTQYSVFAGTPLSAVALYMNVYNENMERTAYTTTKSYVITTADAKYLTITGPWNGIFGDNDKLSTVMLVEGDGVPTAYEPYTAQELTIPFPQTIYGGYVDLVKGEVVEEWNKIVLDGSETWSTQAENTKYYIKYLYTLPNYEMNNNIKARQGIMDYIGLYENTNDGYKTGKLCTRYGWGDRKLYILNAQIGLDETLTTLTAFKDYLSVHPLTMVYPISTPNTYPLDPVTIKALKGINNIWSNTNGDVSVKFWKH